MTRLSASVALAGVALVGVTVPAFAGGHDPEDICHPKAGGYVHIRPDKASAHFDQYGNPKHEHDGRVDVYAVGGFCPGESPTPSPTNTGGSPSPTSAPTTTTPTTAPPSSPTGQPTTTSPSPSPTSSTSSSTSRPTTTSGGPTTKTPTTPPPVTSSNPTPGSVQPSQTGAPSPRRSVPSSTVAPPELAETGFDWDTLLAGLGILLVGGLMHGARVLGGRNGRQ